MLSKKCHSRVTSQTGWCVETVKPLRLQCMVLVRAWKPLVLVFFCVCVCVCVVVFVCPCVSVDTYNQVLQLTTMKHLDVFWVAEHVDMSVGHISNFS